MLDVHKESNFLQNLQYYNIWTVILTKHLFSSKKGSYVLGFQYAVCFVSYKGATYFNF